MTTPDGAFSASLDADSEGEEGKFYVWSLHEITQVLGAENADFFARHYDVTVEGNSRATISSIAWRGFRQRRGGGRLSTLRERLLRGARAAGAAESR
jgi:uncharacterized protein YyaL (SSP411 family)